MRARDIQSDLADLVEPPVSMEMLRKQVAAHPQAAAVALELLRTINLAVPARGLVQESLAYGLLQGSYEHRAWLFGRAAPKRSEPGEVLLARDGGFLSLVLDRPAARNAIDRTMRDALHEAFTVAALDPEVTVVSLRAVGPTFSIGADLDEFGTTRDPATAHAIRMQTLPALAIIPCAPKVAAHVQGACIGSGLEIAAFARRLTASSDAWFQLPELAMGLIPGAGGNVSVARRIGRRRAVLMVLSGKRIGARVALDWGLIDAIIDDPAIDDRDRDIVG